MIAAVVVCVLLAALCANLARFFYIRSQAAEDEVRRYRALVVDLRDELSTMTIKARNERTAADAYVSRMRETAAAAAQVEARLQSDDPEKIAEAINKALDL